MFNFLDNVGDYEQRKIAKYEAGDLFISTAFTHDTGGYETAVSHPRYNDNRLVIVAEYADDDSARRGHDEWVAKMTADELPESLRDVSSAPISQACDLSGIEWRERPQTEREAPDAT